MDNRIQEIIDRIKRLEEELAEEVEKKEAEFFYTIRGKKVRFEREIKKQHKIFVKRIAYYLKDAPLLNILTVPVIWACLVPALLLDLVVSIYQAICFPIYRIPKVRRSKFIIIDRHSLSYLNLIERLNCVYCGYFNGLNNGKFGMGLYFPTWNNNHCFIAARGRDSGKDIYAAIYAIVDENYTLITQDIIEVEAVETGLVSATNISEDISATGHIAIYDVRFSADKADILPESAEALAIVADFLKANADQQFIVVGHAAGVGDFDSGMKLSRERAKAVMDELVSKYGVAGNQLEAYGVGALCPVASNNTEEGAAKNRRVEIVKR